MKERPILFSGAMVRAILDGSKTQTRRIVKHESLITKNADGTPKKAYPKWHAGQCGVLDHGPVHWNIGGHAVKCPYGRPGDRLWVRETFALTGDNASPIVHPIHGGAAWRATDHAKGFKWKPSIHMPRWASRITLEIVSVRVERLQDISDIDAYQEGVLPARPHGKEDQYLATPREGFAQLWQSINGPGSWDANPFVWVVEFRRLERSGS